MIKEKNGFSVFLSKNLEMYKKYQSEIIKPKEKDRFKLQNDFKELLTYYENCLKDNKEITKEDKEKILELIILTLSVDKANNTIENSLEAIDIIASNNYFEEDIVDKQLNNLGKNLLSIYGNYNSSVKIMMQEINLIKILMEGSLFNLRNESFYNIIVFLLLNIIQINNSDTKTTTYQVRKMAKLVLNKVLDDLISKSSKISYDVENNHNYNYFICYGLNDNLYNNFINLIIKNCTDNCIENLVKNDKKIIYSNKNEKGIDKGKYNWCFNCRNQANYFSKELSLPICSKKCENSIKYTEKVLNPKIYYDNKTYSVFDDYINVIKLITYNIICFLEQYLFNENDNIKKNFQQEIMAMDDKLNYFIEIVYKLLSQPIIKDSEKNNFILELIKEFVFPFIIEICYFYKRANNLNGFQNNIKLFELIINELDDWYLQNLKFEIYTFTDKIILPFFSKNIYDDDFLNNSSNHINHLIIKHYLIELLSSNLLDFYLEIHANFDSHFYYKNIFVDILDNLTNIIYDSYDKKFNFESKLDIDVSHKLKMAALNFINKITLRIEKFANELDSKNNEDKDNIINDQKITNYINIKTILEEALEKFNVNPSSVINLFIKKNIIPQTKDFIQYKDIYINNSMNISEKEKIIQKDSKKRRRYKYNFPIFPKLFNPETDINNIFNDFFSINFSISLNYDDFTAYILSLFIRLQFEKIITNCKQSFSNFFSSFSPFNIKVLNYYINSFNFENYNILEGLHLIFNYLPFVENISSIEKIINIFTEKYIKDNFNLEDISTNNSLNVYFIKICKMIMEVSSWIVLEEEMKKKKKETIKLKTINEYISSFKKDFEYYKESERLPIMNYSYIYDIYNLTLANPINTFEYPNATSLVDSNGIIKSNNELYGIFPSTLVKLEIIKKIDNNDKYISKYNFNKEIIRNIINSSWGFFFGIFSKYIAYYNDNEHMVNGIENILRICKTSGMMKSYTVSDAFLQSIIKLTGILESSYQKIFSRNILVLKTFMTFVQDNGKYIYSSWYSIFSFLSKINQLKKCKGDLIYNIIKNKALNKKHFIENYDYNSKQVELIDIEPIYTITKELTDEILKKFILDLTKVSEEEIDFFKNGANKKNKERFFSYNKLVYVIDVNRERWKIEENKEFYEKTKQFFVKLITENPLDDILLNKVKESFKMIDKNEKS